MCPNQVGTNPRGHVATVLPQLSKLLGGLETEVEKTTPTQIWLKVRAADLREIAGKLRRTFWDTIHFATITGIDSGDRFELIYHIVVDDVLLNLKAFVDRKKPEIKSVADLLPAADSHEREVHDMLGIVFTGRSSTPPLVLPDNWEEGFYPLRKSQKAGDQGA